MFSSQAALVLEAALREAVSRRHAFFCVEHILYALLFDDRIQHLLKACGGKVDELKNALRDFFEHHIERVPEKDATTLEPVQTPAVQRVLQRAIVHTQSAQKIEVRQEDILVAIFAERESHAVYFLRQQNISRLDVLNFIAHGISKVDIGPEESEDGDFEDEFDDEAGEEGEDSRRSALERFAEDLTAQAERGELDPVIGRDEEVQRTLKILARRQKNNPLYLGEPGVGKSAMAHAIAGRIVAGQVPDVLAGSRLFSLNMGSLIAGTRFRGEFEERIRKVLTELENIPKAILFIDEIHMLIGAGATGTGSIDAAGLLKGPLQSGKLRCIGSTTHDDWKKFFEKDCVLSRRFSPIELHEPSIGDTVKILEGLRTRFEEHHGAKYSAAALRAAAELSARYITDRFLPDKAIDVIDEAGATNRLLPVEKRKRTIGEPEVESVVSVMARVPVKSVSSDESQLLKNLASNIKLKLYGQDGAVDSVVRAIKRNRAGLRSPTRPVGCFLFAGPTGVGKTELAKLLASELGVPFHRFDMSEYMEKHAVSRLIGAPPGYVGYDEGGQLTDLVRRAPHAVLLLDELEKAHPDIFNILLQVMDDARLTDSHGKVADFRNIILIMTTNAGSERAGGLGFGEQRVSSGRDEALKKLFRPEFRNRLDETIQFAPLALVSIERIAEKFIAELEAQLSEKKVHFNLSAEAKRHLAERGFDVVLGARPMARLIQREIKDQLADELLFGKLQHGGDIDIRVDEGKLLCVVRESKPSKTSGSKKKRVSEKAPA